jgi:hypothetical protein
MLAVAAPTILAVHDTSPRDRRPQARSAAAGRPSWFGTLSRGALLVALALAAAGCAASRSSTPTTTTLSPAQARQEVAHAYEVLFDLASPALAPKLAVVQDGAALRSAMQGALRSPLARLAAGARVRAVTLATGAACAREQLPSPCAVVTYDVLSKSGTPLLAGAKGLALEQNGRWVVARTTICSLLSLEAGGRIPAGCA